MRRPGRGSPLRASKLIAPELKSIRLTFSPLQASGLIALR